MVGGEKTLAHSRVWGSRGRNDRPRRETEGVRQLQSARVAAAGETHVNERGDLENFAARYAKVWCSQNPESVAAFFAEKGSLKVNNQAPAVGRVAIAAIARGFMHD